MLAAVRQEQIKNMVLNDKVVSVVKLSELFSVTEETIRRDLNVLEEEGILIRKHGGAIIANKVLSGVNNNTLEKVFVENKHKIAVQCKRFIKNGDCLFFDSSTTAYHVCKEIADMKLTVLTNSLSVMNLFSDKEHITLIGAGGTLSKSRNCFIGRNAVNFLRSYHVDKAFFSCRSISMEEGITESNDDVAETKQVVIKRANQVFLIADHSKFNKVSFTQICDFDDIDDIITDRPLPGEWQQFARDRRIRLWDPSTVVEESQLPM